MRRVVLGVIAIALFAVAAVAAVWVLTRERPPGPAAPVPTALAPQAPDPLQPALGALPTLAPTAPQATPAPIEYGPPRVEPPKGSWEAVPVVARASALGPLGGAIGRGLNELETQLAGCFDEDTAARFGRQPHTVANDASLPDVGTPVLVLEIETGGGEARIVDAPVDTQGGASDGVIACAQGVLRGRRFSFPQAPAGGRYRMLHPLSR